MIQIVIGLNRKRIPSTKITKNLFFQPIPMQKMQVYRKCVDFEGEKKVQMKNEHGGKGGRTESPIVHSIINSVGQPLDIGTCVFMESKFFGHTLGRCPYSYLKNKLYRFS
jgi:hypothetical protein